MNKNTPEEVAFALRVSRAAVSLFRKEVERAEDALWGFAETLEALSPEVCAAIAKADRA